MNFVILIVAAALVAYGASRTLDISLVERFIGTEKDKDFPLPNLAISLGGAGILCVLAILAGIYHWTAFAPLLILAAAIWQLLSYTHYSWLLMIGLTLTGWLAAGCSLSAPLGLLSVIFGPFVLVIITVILYCSLSWNSYKEDKLVDAIKSERK